MVVAEDSNEEAPDRTPAKNEFAVTVDVNNVEETGTVSLSQVQLQVGVPVTAKVSDPDEGVTGVMWQWSAQSGAMCPAAGDPTVDGDWVRIEGATSATYTPLPAHALDTDGDGVTESGSEMCLQATASYTDDMENTATEDIDTTFIDETLDRAHNSADDNDPVEPKTTANKAPSFTAEDLDEDGTDETGMADAPFMREVDENEDADTNVGNPLGVDDDDTALIYTLGGADAAAFEIGSSTGQITTAEKLDYEMKPSYMVAVTATDPSLASGTAMVMIMVSDENDNAEITGDEPEDFAENGEGAVASFSATDQDGDDIEWDVGGDDGAKFAISEEGVLSFKDAPDFESPVDADMDNVYEVTVMATGGTKDVKVTVTDVEEDGSVSLSQPQPQVEIEVDADRSDPDGNISGTTWQWSKSMDMSDWMGHRRGNVGRLHAGCRRHRQLPARDCHLHRQSRRG